MSDATPSISSFRELNLPAPLLSALDEARPTGCAWCLVTSCDAPELDAEDVTELLTAEAGPGPRAASELNEGETQVEDEHFLPH